MGLLFALVAAVAAAFCNLLLRMSISAGGNSRGYLAVQVTMTFLTMILLSPVREHNLHVHWPVVYLGFIGGLILGLFFWAFGKTMETGPASISVAALNATAVVPGLVMAVLFGSSFGHTFTTYHALGLVLVVAGILWAGASKGGVMQRTWIYFVCIMFICHSLYLIFLQWWAMVLNPQMPTTSLLPHLSSEDIHWFMPAIFFVAALFQIGIAVSHERRWPSQKEMWYGLIGGVSNGICSLFLILAPQVAAPWENALIFPTFSVGIILLCNGWASWFYRESINWKACGVCALGVLVGTLAWNA